MESLVLIAAVAVEGIVKAMIDEDHLPPGVSAVSEEDARTWRERATEALLQLECPERIRNRVDGLFTRMGGIAALDVLIALQKHGAVDEDLVALWRKTRPGSAHGSGHRGKTAQEIIRAADGLVTLLRQLTFWWIGYRGLYTKLAPGGWHAFPYSPRGVA